MNGEDGALSQVEGDYSYNNKNNNYNNISKINIIIINIL